MSSTQWISMLVLAGAACGGGAGGAGRGADTTKAANAALTGAGATFPDPIYKKWFAEYARKTGVQINYQSIGSGGGIRQFTEGTVDFGASDGPMNDTQISAVQGQVIHLPTVLGAVVVTYNLPALGTTPLRFDGATLADIFLGKVTKWNDRRVAATNPGAKLPASDIIVVHRSDGSGTSYVWTDYLSKVSPEWKSKVGTSTAVNWPVGLGGKGNEGVTQQVKQTVGALGYVELIYAISNNLPYAQVENRAGHFVTPSLASVTAAAASAEFPPNTDFRVSITDPNGPDAYPVASFTWLLVRPDMPDANKARTLKAFLEWMTSDEAQGMAEALHYSPLPKPVAAMVQERIKTLKAAGAPMS
jgi:phosphate transport system substrate-binding protein